MTYASNLENESVESQYLLVMKPRRRAESWTSLGSNKYKTAFSYGQAVAVTIDGTTCTEVASSAALVSNNQFFYDIEAEELYVRTAASPIADAEIIATYELYLGTFDAYWYRDPLDDESRTVYFEPLIMRTPEIVSNLTDSLFGYMPSGSTQIAISNVTKYLQEHLYASSFKKASVDLYHWIGELELANVKLVFRGLVESIDASDNEVSFRVLDRNNVFDIEYRNPDVANNFFGTSAFPLIDPNFANRPVRTVYGKVDGVIGVNYDFGLPSPTPPWDQNRYHCLSAGSSGFPTVTRTVPASPSSTTTRTYLNSVAGLQVGDDVFLDHASGPSFDENIVITAIGANYIEHDTIGTLAATGSTVTRSFIGNAWLIKEGVTYRLTGDEYSTLLDVTPDVAAIEINQLTLEANRGSGFFVTSNDVVFCRVYGKTNNVELESTPLGSDSTATGNLTGIVPILVDVLKGAVGLSEAEIDTDALQALAGTVDDELGFTLPFASGSDFPLCREIVGMLSSTGLLRVFVDDDGLWSCNQLGPIGSVDKSIDDDELLEGDGVTYSIDYSELISDVIVEYARSEVTSRNQISSQGVYTSVRSESTLARRLHGVTKQKTFQSLHFTATQAQRLADRLLFVFSERRGTIRLSAKTRFFDSEIGQVIRVTRSQLPGFSFDQDTLRSRDFAVQAVSKSFSEVQLILDDQKGVEDNAGDW